MVASRQISTVTFGFGLRLYNQVTLVCSRSARAATPHNRVSATQGPAQQDCIKMSSFRCCRRDSNLILVLLSSIRSLIASSVMLFSDMCFYIDISGQPVRLNYAHSNLFKPWRTSINSKNIPQRKLWKQSRNHVTLSYWYRYDHATRSTPIES